MKLSSNFIPSANQFYSHYVERIGYSNVPKVEFVNKPIKNNSVLKKIGSLFKSKDKTVKIFSDDYFNGNESLISIKNGNTFGIDGTTYVNNNGKLEALNITPEKFEELFPKNQNHTATQCENLGDCWLVSTLNGLMNKPNGRISIYRKFGQDWDSMYVKVPKLDTFFFNTKIIEEKEYQLSGPKGLQMLEEAIALTKSVSATNDFHYATKMTDFYTIMDNLNGGSQTTALYYINPNWNPKIINLNKTNKQISLIKKYANKDNVFLGIMTTKNKEEKELLKKFNKSFDGKLMPLHAFNIMGYDKSKNIVTVQDPLSPKNLIHLTIEEMKKYPYILTMCKL